MEIETVMDKSSAYILSQRRSRNDAVACSRQLKPTITISHEIGAGASEIAGELANVLQKSGEMGTDRWEVLDQQLVEKALLQQRWPKKLAETIREEKRFFIDEWMYDLFGLCPPSWVLMPQLIETTMSLAVTGHVILVGHGATIVTAKSSNVFHVRLTGSLPRRIERVQRIHSLTHEDAAKFVRTEDQRREKYLKAHFHARMDNELLYDLVINTDRVSDADAVAIISESVRRFFPAS